MREETMVSVKVILFFDHLYHNSRRIGIRLPDGKVAIESKGYIEYWPEVVPKKDIVKVLKETEVREDFESRIRTCKKLRTESAAANDKLRRAFESITQGIGHLEM